MRSANLRRMDTQVLAAIARWPNVPAVFGWLSLSARGDWRIRGAPIANAAFREFIGRNYASDERGRWFFQNGPQRVYVSLECAPWVFRVQADGSLLTHAGARPTRLAAAALVDGATFVLQTDLGAGNIDDRDAALFLAALAEDNGGPLSEAELEAVLQGERSATVVPARCAVIDPAVALCRLSCREVPAAFGFEPSPQPD